MSAFSQSMIRDVFLGQTVHQTTRGAAGSKYSAYVSIDAPLEVQQQVVRDSLELAKMCIGESSSESTKVDVGASGKVAIYIGKGQPSPI